MRNIELKTKAIESLKSLNIEIIISKRLNGLFKRKCPTCQNIIEYTSATYVKNMALKKEVCQDCKLVKKHNVFVENGIWYRICSQCQRRINYKDRSSCSSQQRKNHICKSCASYNVNGTDPDKNIPKGVFFEKNNGAWGVWFRICKKCGNTVKCKSRAAAINGMEHSNCKYCAPHGLEGKTHSEKSKKKLSEHAFRRWSNPEFREKLNKHFSYVLNGAGKIRRRSWNLEACSYLDKANEILKNKGYFFRHARNSSEGEFTCLCYFADGYDEKNNIWFEYDESYHEILSQKKKDHTRERRIMGKLKGRFIRYSEKYKILYEMTSDGSCKKLGNICQL